MCSFPSFLSDQGGLGTRNLAAPKMARVAHCFFFAVANPASLWLAGGYPGVGLVSTGGKVHHVGSG